MVFRGQIWIDRKKNPTRWEHDTYIYVCGVNNDWVYYTFLHANNPYRNTSNQPWKKSKVEHFESKYEFTKHAIAPKAYWKSRANGNVIQIVGIKDDGWSTCYIYYDLNKISLNDFFEFFEPCTKIEVMAALSREKSITKKEQRMKRRIAMTPGRYFDPGQQ